MPTSNHRHRIFVYGTLRRGQRHHHRLGRALALGACATRPVFTLINAGGFPGVIEPGGQAVAGEVYEIGAGVLRALDELEGHPHLFTRKLIETDLGLCWIYIYRRANGHEAIVASGDWVRR